MITESALGKKIETMFPEFGRFGVDFKVHYDEQVHAWSVDIYKGKQHLKTFIEDSDADSCIGKNRCVPLALQIAQLKRNFNQYLQEHALEKDH